MLSCDLINFFIKRCTELEQAFNHPFGKRDFSLVGGCCIGDSCNRKPVGEQTTTTPSPSTTTPLTTTKHAPVRTTTPISSIYS